MGREDKLGAFALLVLFVLNPSLSGISSTESSDLDLYIFGDKDVVDMYEVADVEFMQILKEGAYLRHDVELSRKAYRLFVLTQKVNNAHLLLVSIKNP